MKLCDTTKQLWLQLGEKLIDRWSQFSFLKSKKEKKMMMLIQISKQKNYFYNLDFGEVLKNNLFK